MIQLKIIMPGFLTENLMNPQLRLIVNISNRCAR